MANPDGTAFGDDAPEADVVEQLIPIDVSDEDTWREKRRVSRVRGVGKRVKPI